MSISGSASSVSIPLPVEGIASDMITNAEQENNGQDICESDRRDSMFRSHAQPIINLLDEAEDDRTTLMVRNVPCKYTQNALVEEIQSMGFKLNFLYLPNAYKSRGNLGYAFVNFVTAEDARRFLSVFQNYKWQLQQNSVKSAQVIFANEQGLEANMKCVMTRKVGKSPSRPWVLRSALAGTEVTEFHTPETSASEYTEISQIPHLSINECIEPAPQIREAPPGFMRQSGPRYSSTLSIDQGFALQKSYSNLNPEHMQEQACSRDLMHHRSMPEMEFGHPRARDLMHASSHPAMRYPEQYVDERYEAEQRKAMIERELWETQMHRQALEREHAALRENNAFHRRLMHVRSSPDMRQPEPPQDPPGFVHRRRESFSKARSTPEMHMLHEHPREYHGYYRSPNLNPDHIEPRFSHSYSRCGEMDAHRHHQLSGDIGRQHSSKFGFEHQMSGVSTAPTLMHSRPSHQFHVYADEYGNHTGPFEAF